VLAGLITQNVDQLHSRAGHREVIELHGALGHVRCLRCNTVEDRDALQHRLLLLNPGWLEQNAELAPDGDAELSPSFVRQFTVASCLACDGVLKPDVVFFGGNVATEVVERAYRVVDDSQALLVLGSSLTVFSGLRFVRRAHEQQKPIAIVNLGPTRGDPFATVLCDQSVTEVVPQLAERLVVSL
jgi:NAD-dependent SIR2 family protein deacetylase